jgi:hypothetical protein
MGSSDFWYVKLPNGDVHRVTLDQLDEAFRGGHIDGRTKVMGASTERWMTLAEILSDDEQPESPAARPARPLAYGHVPHTPYSLRPMSVDFEDLDVDIAPRRRGSGTRWAFAAVAIAAAFGGVAAVRPDLRASAVARVQAGIRTLSAARTHTVAAASLDPVAVTPSPAAVSPAPAPPPAVAAPVAAPAAATPPSSAPAAAGDSALTSRFAAQANQPKPQPRSTKIQRKPGAPSRAKTSAAGPKPASQVFTTGGNKFDPLNSSI